MDPNSPEYKALQEQWDYPATGQNQVWDRVSAQIASDAGQQAPRDSKSRKISGLLICICILLVGVAGLLIAQNQKISRLYAQPNYQANLSERFPDYKVKQASYEHHLSQATSTIASLPITSPDITALYAELRALDSIHSEVIKELRDGPMDERTLYIQIAYQDRRLIILENIISLQQKERKYENDNTPIRF